MSSKIILVFDFKYNFLYLLWICLNLIYVLLHIWQTGHSKKYITASIYNVFICYPSVNLRFYNILEHHTKYVKVTLNDFFFLSKFIAYKQSLRYGLRVYSFFQSLWRELTMFLSVAIKKFLLKAPFNIKYLCIKVYSVNISALDAKLQFVIKQDIT